MPELLLLRHAKSDWDADYGRDFDRPLSGRGRKAAAKIGRLLADEPPIGSVFASPARRVAETVRIVGEHCPHFPKPQWVERLYGASPRSVIEFVRRLDGADRVMIAGHNPTTHVLAASLAAPDGSEAWQALQQKYPTGALAELRFGSWEAVAAGQGQLVRFVRPRDL